MTNKILNLGLAATTALIDQVNAMAQMNSAMKNQSLETISMTVGALAKAGHVQELQSTITAINKQIMAGGLMGQPWVKQFEKTVGAAASHFGNGHAHGDSPVGGKPSRSGSRRHSGAGSHVSAE